LEKQRPKKVGIIITFKGGKTEMLLKRMEDWKAPSFPSSLVLSSYNPDGGIYHENQTQNSWCCVALLWGGSVTFYLPTQQHECARQ
jgi:hypothetical protein